MLAMAALATLLLPGPAAAWIETSVTGDEARIEIDRAGTAVIEHRIGVRTNGSERLRSIEVMGVDADAEPLAGAYAVPQREAVASSLEGAVPLSVGRVAPKEAAAAEVGLRLEVADPRGLSRGAWVLVVRYRTDLRARGLVAVDGALERVRWLGPRWPQGFDNPRVVFLIPSAPTAPQAVEDPEPAGDAPDDAGGSPVFLADVRRGIAADEVELLRTYAPRGEALEWVVRVDPRAFEGRAAPTTTVPPDVDGAPLAAPPEGPVWRAPDRRMLVAAAALFLFYLALMLLKSREVRREAERARARVPPIVPLPLALRAPLAAAALSGGVALELVFDRLVGGAVLVVVACVLGAHGAAQPISTSLLRGPGRWLTVSEREAFAAPPPLPRTWLDTSSPRGRALLVLFFGALAVPTALLARLGRPEAALVALDAVALLSIFGTGRALGLPPDMGVEPGRFLGRVIHALRRHKGATDLRLVARLRIPHADVDADELRLLVAPRLPLRGFAGIEVGVTYALGVATRVAMPEVLVRVVAGSPSDEALALVSRSARITPGRKPDERVLAFTPRLPTARMTASLALALALRILERSGAQAAPPVSAPRAA
jgi:hypothetical protein